MNNNRGMTLAEVLIGSFVFAIISIVFTTGLFMTMRLINAAGDRQIMERAAEEIILIGDPYYDAFAEGHFDGYFDYLGDRSFGVTITEDTDVDITIVSPVDGYSYPTIRGKKITVSVGYRQGFHGDDVELFNFIFEGFADAD